MRWTKSGNYSAKIGREFAFTGSYRGIKYVHRDFSLACQERDLETHLEQEAELLMT